MPTKHNLTKSGAGSSSTSKLVGRRPRSHRQGRATGEMTCGVIHCVLATAGCDEVLLWGHAHHMCRGWARRAPHQGQATGSDGVNFIDAQREPETISKNAPQRQCLRMPLRFAQRSKELVRGRIWPSSFEAPYHNSGPLPDPIGPGGSECKPT